MSPDALLTDSGLASSANRHQTHAHPTRAPIQKASSEPTTHINAAAPFNNVSAADAILRASDGVDFWVRSSILAEASPIFEDMLRIPTPPPGSPAGDEMRDGRPVIRLAECAATLDRLLRLCYPVEDPTFRTLDELRPTLAAAMKYMMAEATMLLRRRLVRFGQMIPLRAFALACALRLGEEADALAPAAHRAFGLFVEEFNEMSAGTYFRLSHLSLGDKKKASPKRRGEPHMTILDPPLPPLTELEAASPGPACPFLPDLSGADVVLEAADGMQFHVHTSIVALASPALSKMISSCRNPDGTNGPVFLEESGRTLSVLLMFIYPLPSPPLPVIWDELKALVEAAHKYNITCALSPLRAALLSHIPPEAALSPSSSASPSTLAPSDAVLGPAALRVFVLAHRLGLASERAAAARALLRLSGDTLRACYVPELEVLDAAAYFRLRQYHDRAGHAAAECVRLHALAYHSGDPGVKTSANARAARPSTLSCTAGHPAAAPPTGRGLSRSQTTGAPNVRGDLPSPPTSLVGVDYSEAADSLRLCAQHRPRSGGQSPCQVVLDDTSARPWARFRRDAAPRWWLMYVYKLGTLVRTRPWAGLARDGGLKRRALARMVECEVCRSRFLLGFEAYVEHLVGEIERTVGEIKLDIK